jgi:luciferase family oxidoreductase group 1
MKRKGNSMADFSVFDLVPVTQGSTPAEALRRSLELAQKAEAWGYKRFWVAEHHNMAGIASAATSVVIGYLAGGTRTIRVGSGGVMLPNHSPLVIAEQFGTLETLYPGRIDLGLGRAPGTDQRTLLALRRNPGSSESFPQDVMELQSLLGPFLPGQPVRAVPGTDTNVPLWILGSSLFGAQLAALLGLPYAFAAHFAPKDLMEALAHYRHHFQKSASLKRPYAMACVNVIAAETDGEARRLFTSAQQSITNIFRGKRGQMPPPLDDIEAFWTPDEKVQTQAWLARSFVGSAKTIEKGLKEFIEETEVDEVMAHSAIYDHKARLRSYEILSGVMRGL